MFCLDKAYSLKCLALKCQTNRAFSAGAGCSSPGNVRSFPRTRAYVCDHVQAQMACHPITHRHQFNMP